MENETQSIRSYRDLIVWQKAIAFTEQIYRLTGRFPSTEAFGLTNQLRRAAISIPSNIAEGQARHHTKEFSQFLYIALGSLAEIDTQLVVGRKLVTSEPPSCIRWLNKFAN